VEGKDDKSTLNPDCSRKLLAEETEKWREVVKFSGAKPD
jgi:hypothetical protein